jgi:hypothetical protein
MDGCEPIKASLKVHGANVAGLLTSQELSGVASVLNTYMIPNKSRHTHLKRGKLKIEL